MLLAIVATAATIASKFGSALIGASAIGPIVHQFIVGALHGSNASSKVLLLSADVEQSCVTVSKDEQSCVAETLAKVSESKEMVQPVSQAMVQYESSSKVVANLSNEPIGKSLFDTFIEAMVIFMTLAAWYRSRIAVMLQSTFRLLLGDEHCTNQKKEEFTEATRVIQRKIYLLVALAINRCKEIIHSLLGPLLLVGAGGQLHCGLLTAETVLTIVLQLLAMLFAATNGVFHAIQKKICLFVASAINRWNEIIYPCSNASTVLGPLLSIEAEVKVEPHLRGISAAGTALISAMQHLVMLFAAVKGVLLEYKSSRRMKQFASMLLMLLIGVLALSGSSRGIQPLIPRSSISSCDTDGLEDLMGLAATSSSAVSVGLSDFMTTSKVWTSRTEWIYMVSADPVYMVSADP